jgi:hypothetical protein
VPVEEKYVYVEIILPLLKMEDIAGAIVGKHGNGLTGPTLPRTGAMPRSRPVPYPGGDGHIFVLPTSRSLSSVQMLSFWVRSAIVFTKERFEVVKDPVGRKFSLARTSRAKP